MAPSAVKSRWPPCGNAATERIPDGTTPDPSQSVAEAKDAFLESLKASLLQVRDSIAKTQARHKRD